ncbi:hypothetical protein NADFUDRAFT_41158 [Nadsonia fulvescens var. elongata DSM 6958]|uniref:CP-type G domain-containing protein n=1 Tax=Nadsonia fulvescens var. elongata DSM 6958 TaxID=857566 RepID=A0A1E3PM66_9ASCO|nr:hypothetical protein NADFUDRAFT_41158 [Nadsonia fulvescens var. elongata DSM 6958]
MKVSKPTSKRRSTKMVEGLKKKSAAHQRKQKKLAKKDVTWRSKHKKDPGIPSSFPYKDRILEEIEEKRRQDLAAKEQKKVETQAKRALARAQGIDIEEEMEDDEATANPLAALLASAQAAAKVYEGVDEEDQDIDRMEDDSDEEVVEYDIDFEEGDESGSSNDTSRRTFDKIYKKVVDAADVILYVLDARDPEGTRSKQVESAVLSNPSKRMIFIINKIDLVPADVLKKWLDHLRLSFPTLPLRASTPAANAQVFANKSLTQQATSGALLNALKTYASASHLKRSIIVGVVGYPNVGKSSVINSLTRQHGYNQNKPVACPVGAQAGVTTSLREVKVDNKLKILDSPGIVFPSEGKIKRSVVEEQARLILLNALPPKQIEDAQPAVSLLLKRLRKNPDLWARLKETYDLPSLIETTHKDLVTGFLVHVARKTGRLGKGGIPNLASAATVVVTDWRDGRIAGWNLPKAPVEGDVENTAADAHATSLSTNNSLTGTIAPKKQADHKEIVSQWSAEFSLAGLWAGNFEE